MKSSIITLLLCLHFPIIAQGAPEGFGPVLWTGDIHGHATKPLVVGNLVVVACSERSLESVDDNFETISFYDLNDGKLLHRIKDKVPKDFLPSPPIMVPMAHHGNKVFYTNSKLQLCSVEIENRIFKRSVILDMARDLDVQQRPQLDYIKFIGGIVVHKNCLFINTRQVLPSLDTKLGPSLTKIDLNNNKLIWKYTKKSGLSGKCAPARPIIITFRDKDYVLSPIGACKFCCLNAETGKEISEIDLARIAPKEFERDLFQCYMAPIQVMDRLYFMPSPDYDAFDSECPMISLSLEDIVLGKNLDSKQVSTSMFCATMGEMTAVMNKILVLDRSGSLHVVDAKSLRSHDLAISKENSEYGAPHCSGKYIVIPGDTHVFAIAAFNDPKVHSVRKVETTSSRRVNIDCVGDMVLIVTNNTICSRKLNAPISK